MTVRVDPRNAPPIGRSETAERAAPQNALQRPVRADLFDGLQNRGPGNLLERLEAGLKSQLARLGISEADLRQAGKALPHALHGVESVRNGDFEGALRDLESIGQEAPDLTRKLGRGVSELIPDSLERRFSNVRINRQSFRELAAALPKAIQTARAVEQGDWQGALKSAGELRNAAPGLARKLERAALGVVPEGLKNAVENLGLGYRDLRTLRDTLPHAIDAAKQLEQGNWEGALQSLEAIGDKAPRQVAKLRDAVIDALPDGVKESISRLGIDGQDLRELRGALPAAIKAGEALATADWKGALEQFEAIRQAAPELSQKAGDAILRAVPPAIRESIGKLGIDAQDVRELGAGLPHLLDAAAKLESGDWHGAFQSATAAAGAAPGLASELKDAALRAIPQDVRAAVDRLGIDGKQLAELGAALPHAAQVARALESGDWESALQGLGNLKNAAPTVVNRLGDAVSGIVPQNFKDRLSGMGLTGENLGKLGAALPDAIDVVRQLEAGNTAGALNSIGNVLGDLGFKDKLEKSLGLPPGGLDQALAEGKVDVASFKFSKTIGDDPRGRLNPLAAMNPGGRLQQALNDAAGVNLAQGSFKVGGSLAQAQGAWGKPGGPLYAEGAVKFGEASAGGYGYVNADLKNLQLTAGGRVEAGVYLVNAQGKVTSNYGIGSTELAGNAMIGANAEAEGTIKIDPRMGTAMLDIDGEAFAGAQAGVSLKQTLGPIGVEGKASVSAGIGFDFGLDAGFQNGKLTAKFDIGAALGIGFDIEFGITIDVKGIVEGAWKGIKAVGGAILKGAGKAAEWLGDTAKKVGGAVVDGVKAVGNAIGDGVKAVGNAIGDGVKSVGKAIGKVFSGW